MKSIKLHQDTLDALRAVKARKGGSYDNAIASILKKQTEVVEPLLHGAAQLDRIELLLIEIKDLLCTGGGPKIKPSPDTFVVQ